MKSILVIGSLNIDFAVNVDEIPVRGETCMGSDLQLIPGGKGANQACAVGKLGGKVTMLGAVGRDNYADMEMDSLRDAGVTVSNIIRRDEVHTGIAWIAVNRAGDNVITVVPGANASLGKEDIDQHMELIRQHDIVILQMEIPLETVIYAAKCAKEAGKMVILDPAPAPKRFPEELYSYVDIIKPNETELSILTGLEENEVGKNLEKATNYLTSAGVGCVMVSMGKQGVFINEVGKEPYIVKGISVNAVDSTAAGDTFTAAVAVSLAKGNSILKATEYANLAAAISVTKKGAQTSIPTYEEVEQWGRSGIK